MKLGRIEGNGGTDTLLPTVKWNCVDHKPQKRGTTTGHQIFKSFINYNLPQTRLQLNQICNFLGPGYLMKTVANPGNTRYRSSFFI